MFDLLVEAGIEVFYDDRDESPGVKLNDGDLLGFPVRVVVSKRNIAEGMVELKSRNDEETVRVLLDETVAAISDKLSIYESLA